MAADGRPGPRAIVWPLIALLPTVLAAVPLSLDRPATAPLAVPAIETPPVVVVAPAVVAVLAVAVALANVMPPAVVVPVAVIKPPPVVPPPLEFAPPPVVPPPVVLVKAVPVLVVVEFVAVMPGTVLRGVVLPTLPKPNRLFGVAVLVMLVVPLPTVLVLIIPAVSVPF